ncbi:MAG: response regulator [Lachnospiraceae bacterium]|nr:response regulator [Lachnospiraceae bacterium]
MGILINCVMIMLATVVMVAGIHFYIREKDARQLRSYMLFMAIFAAAWCGGYGYMGFCEDESMALFGRNIGLSGCIGFLLTEALFLLQQCVVAKSIRKVLDIIIVLIGAIDLIVFGQAENISFTRVDYRTCYYAEKTFGRSFHNIFIVVIALTMSLTGLFLYRQGKKLRDKQIIKTLYVTNLILLAFALPDTILPSLNLPSFPSSGLGGVTVFISIWYVTVKLNAFNITAQNMGAYVWGYAESGILVFTTDMDVALTNDFAKKFFQFNSYAGKKFIDLFQVSSEESAEMFQKILSGKESKDIHVVSRKNQISCSLNFTVIRDSHDDPYCLICFVYDLTKEEAMLLEAQRANQAKSEFLANMSHEIRTPINAVLGMDEMILRESKDEEIRGYATDIRSAGQTLLSLINDILDFSKIESGKIEILPVKYDVASLLNDSYNMVAMRAKEKQLKFSLENEETIPSVLYGDEIRIRQIWTNLMTNAVKYTKEGSVTIKISWKKQEDNRMLLICAVEDTGVGISQENQKLLFESFQRIEEKKNRNIEGTGLGLTITKQLVDLMGGTIRVESEYGKGSIFTVEIPQTIVKDVPLGDFAKKYIGSTETVQDYEEKFQAPDAKILVVDDVPMNLKVMSGLLKNTKIQIDTALSGKECLEKVQQNVYHIIFMDHMMPEMDGIETLGRMQQIPDCINKDTPVIVLTANAILGVKEEYISSGFSDYLSKPIKWIELENMVLKYLPEELIQKEKTERVETVKTEELEQKENSSAISPIEKIDFLDKETAMQYCCGDNDFYCEMLNSYIDGDKRTSLDECFEKQDWENYRIQIHALKSTSLSIGAVALSDAAKQLEEAAKAGNGDYITENHQTVMEQYSEILQKIKEIFTKSISI